MKISSNPPAPRPATASGTPAASRSGTAKTQSAPQGSVSGSTSTDAADRLSQLEAQFSQADFSSSKVSEITSAIAAGSYQVNAGAIADKLLASTAALAGSSGAGA